MHHVANSQRKDIGLLWIVMDCYGLLWIVTACHGLVRLITFQPQYFRCTFRCNNSNTAIQTLQSKRYNSGTIIRRNRAPINAPTQNNRGGRLPYPLQTADPVKQTIQLFHIAATQGRHIINRTAYGTQGFHFRHLLQQTKQRRSTARLHR